MRIKLLANIKNKTKFIRFLDNGTLKYSICEDDDPKAHKMTFS